MRGLFVTGTDTGVGKTAVAAGILRLGRRAGVRLVPWKPAESAAPGEPSDADILWEAALRPIPRGKVCLHRFVEPLAPAVAAERAGTAIDRASLLVHARALAAAGEGLVVEGAGGLLVPYGPSFVAADLAADLGLPILLVARAALGTINHTALSVAEIRRRALPLAGILLVETSPTRVPADRDNALWIERTTGLSPLGTLRHLPATHPDALADALAAIPALLAVLGPLLTSPSAR